MSGTAEETIDASRIIPIAITWSVAYNVVALFIIGTALIFCLGDVDSLLSTRTGQPFIQLFYNATQSYAGTSVMASILVVLVECCVINEVATSSRQLWYVPIQSHITRAPADSSPGPSPVTAACQAPRGSHT